VAEPVIQHPSDLDPREAYEMKTSIISPIVIALCAFLIAVAADGQPNPQKTIIRVRGSDSMAGRIDALAKVFMKNNPHTNIVVSGGSLTKPEILKGNGCEVAMFSYKMTDDEMQTLKGSGVSVVERLVGSGGIVIITHPSNTVDELTVDQVRRILTGDYSTWDQVGGKQEPIKVFTIGETHSGTLRFMQADFLKSPITNRAEILSYFPSVVRRVAATPGSIAFTRVRDVYESPIADTIALKALKIKDGPESQGVLPTRENIANQSYPVRRPYFLYLKSDAGEDTKSFVEFVVSKGWGAQTLTAPTTR